MRLTGQQRDTVAFEVAAIRPIRNVEQQHRHVADVAADLESDTCFLIGELAPMGCAAAKPVAE